MAVKFSKDFENNSLADVSVTGGADVSISSAASMAGTGLGLSCLADDATGDYISKTGIGGAAGYARVRFYFNRNGVTCNPTGAIGIFAIYSTVGIVGLVRFEESGGNYSIAFRLTGDSGDGARVYTAAIDGAPHRLEINIWRESADGNNDGGATWFLDGVQQTSPAVIDNFNQFPDTASVTMGLGVVNLPAGLAGTMYFDQLVVKDDNAEIGPYINSANGALLFGYNVPTSKESIVAWPTWDDGAAGAVTVSGNANYGKLQLVAGAEGRSRVYDLGDANPHIFTITENAYGSGQGDADLEIRGSDTTFAQDDALPAWNAYTVPTTQSWRYVQIRESRE